MLYKGINDYEVLYMINDGNEDALEILFSKYEPIIINTVKLYIKPLSLLGYEYEDLMQEAKTAFYYAYKTYKSETNILFYTYSLVCIKSRLNNLWKKVNNNKNKIFNNIVYLDADFDEVFSNSEKYGQLIYCNPESSFILNNYQNQINDYLLNLKIVDSSIFYLKINGFNTCEISRFLDVNVNYVNSNFSKIKKKILEIISKNNI